MDQSFLYNETKSIPEAFSGGIAVFKAHHLLEPHIWQVVHGTVDHPDIASYSSRPIPTGNIVLFIHFNTSIELYDHAFKDATSHRFFVTGVHSLDKLTYIRAHGPVDNLVVSFKPGGFSRFFQVPALAVRNRVVDLDQIVAPEFMALIHQLTRIENTFDRIAKLNEFLICLLNSRTSVTRKNHLEIFELIHQSLGNINIQELSNRLQVTSRTIQRLFQEYIGVSPKEYIRIIRFNAILQFLFENRFKGWQEIIYRFGYFDQAHFIHDFKSVTGFTPAKFINFQQHGTIYLDRFQVVRKVSDLKD